MTVTVRATFRVRPGRGEQFAELVADLTVATREEPGTLRYDWFGSEDPAEYVVLEEYTDADAAITHNKRCGALLEKVPELAEMTTAQLHGVLGPELEAWVKEHSQAHAYPPMER